jgi:hypothetical protein
MRALPRRRLEQSSRPEQRLLGMELPDFDEEEGVSGGATFAIPPHRVP